MKVMYTNMIVFCIFFHIACNLMPTRLPIKRPDDLRVSYSYISGRGLYGESLRISKKKCTYERRYKAITTSFDFTISEKNLDFLYGKLYDNAFDRIGTYKRMIYDRSGVTVSVSYNNKNFRKSNSASYGVRVTSLKNWNAVLQAISNVKKDAIKAKEISVVCHIYSSLKYKKLFLHLNNQTIYSFIPENNKYRQKKKIIFKTIPGKQHLFACLGNCKIYKRKNIIIKNNMNIFVLVERNRIHINTN